MDNQESQEFEFSNDPEAERFELDFEHEYEPELKPQENFKLEPEEKFELEPEEKFELDRGEKFELEPEQEFEHEQKLERKKTTAGTTTTAGTESWLKSMDKFVITAALTLFGLWFLGQCLLWLIGGSSAGTDSLASNTSNVVGSAVTKLMPGKDTSSDSASSDSTNYGQEPIAESKPESGLDQASSAGTVGSKNKSENSAAASRQPTETAYRPTYSEPAPKVKAPTKKATPPKKSTERSGSSARERESKAAETVPSATLDSPRTTEPNTRSGRSRKFPMRNWTSALGNEARLALVRVDGDLVVVVDEQGTEYSLPFARFSKEDQDYARKAFHFD